MVDPLAPDPVPFGALAPPYGSFAEAVEAVLGVLRASGRLSRWAVFYEDREQDVQIAIGTVGRGAPEVQVGDRLPWSSSLCRRLERGAPSVVHDMLGVRDYADAALVRSGQVAAYAGAEIATGDGHVFGTLCGFSPMRTDHTLAEIEPLLTLCARLLSTMLAQPRHAEAAGELVTALDHREQRDALTGLGNQRRWDLAILDHEAGGRAGVIVIGVDGLQQVNDRDGYDTGDRLLQRAAHALTRVVRPDDVLCRVAGDVFAALLPSCTAQDAVTVGERARAALIAAEVPASVGAASRWRGEGLGAVLERAGRAMYAEKALRERRDAIEPFRPDASSVGHQAHPPAPRRRADDR